MWTLVAFGIACLVPITYFYYKSAAISRRAHGGSVERQSVEKIRFGPLWGSFLVVARPYWTSEHKWKARGSLFALIVLAVARNGLSIAASYIGRDYFNALAAKDEHNFWRYLGIFLAIFAIATPIKMYYEYTKGVVCLQWRLWLTEEYMSKYLQGQNYYQLSMQGREGGSGSSASGVLSGGAETRISSEIDNPDQRICDDVSRFTEASLDFFMEAFSSTLDLIAFSYVLFTIYPLLFVGLVVYATFGTTVTAWMGRRMVKLNFTQLKREADFRYSLVRIRENAESIAFYGGESQETRVLTSRLKALAANLMDLILWRRHLGMFTTAYTYFIQVLPIALVAPEYFAGKFEIGVVRQAHLAFNHVLGDLSIMVNEINALTSLSAGSDRLSSFLYALNRPPSAPSLATHSSSSSSTSTILRNRATLSSGAPSLERERLLSSPSPLSSDPYINLVLSDDRGDVSLENITLMTPDRERVLIRDITLTVPSGTRLLIMGESGCGKSSLLRAIAGLWNCGSGSILRPRNAFFLPQKPYMVLGSLRQQLLYPYIDNSTAASSASPPRNGPSGLCASRSHVHHTDEELLDVLEQVNLGHLVRRWSSVKDMGGKEGIPVLDRENVDWSSVLSLGEQQRLAFARLLLSRPALAILDESTGALDQGNEERLYRLLDTRPGMTVVSVGHRPSLVKYHNNRVLRLQADSDGQWAVET